MTKGRTGKVSAVAVALLTVFGAACSSSSKSSSSGGTPTTAAASSSSAGATGSAGSSTGGTVAAQSSLPAGPVTFGAIITLSGPIGVVGQTMQAEFNVATNYVNSHGGIDGHQVKIITKNDQGDPAVAVSAARSLVSSHVAAILYPGLSSVSDQTLPIFFQAKIPVYWAAQDDQYADGTKNPMSWASSEYSNQKEIAIANFAKAIGATKLGIITDTEPDDAPRVADLKKAAAAAGLTISGVQQYSVTAVDVTAQVTAMHSTGAQVVALVTAAGNQFVYQAMNAMNWHPVVLGDESLLFSGYSSLGALKSTAFATCVGGIPAGTQPPPLVAQITQENFAAAKAQNPLLAGAGYLDQLELLNHVITQAGSDSSQSIINGLNNVTNFSYVSPMYTYTMTTTNHGAVPQSRVDMCGMNLGPDQLSVIADPAQVKSQVSLSS